MNKQTISYKNQKYHFKCAIPIKSLAQNDIIKFQKLYYTNQISKKDFINILNIIKKLD